MDALLICSLECQLLSTEYVTKHLKTAVILHLAFLITLSPHLPQLQVKAFRWEMNRLLFA